MTKTEIYNEDYTKLNHAYIQIYDSYKKLVDADDADEEVMMVLASILQVMNPTLDKIKSEMTVSTRFKDTGEDSTAPAKVKAEKEIGSNGEVIFHPKFC